MTRESADREVVTRVADVRQVTDPADIDKDRRRREPQLHQWQQRHATGKELRVLTVLADQRDRLRSRSRTHVVERRGDHFAVRMVSAAASTDFTMLWYPVHRQRLPSRPSRTSRSVGFGISSSNDTAASTIPAVQYPHCRP